MIGCHPNLPPLTAKSSSTRRDISTTENERRTAILRSGSGSTHHVICLLVHRLRDLIFTLDNYIRVHLFLQTLVAIRLQVEHNAMSLSDQQDRQEDSHVEVAHPRHCHPLSPWTNTLSPSPAPQYTICRQYNDEVAAIYARNPRVSIEHEREPPGGFTRHRKTNICDI